MNKDTEQMLDRLVEGEDITHCRIEAREFLRALLMISSHEVNRVALPIARRLCAYDGWQQRLDVIELRDYCAARVKIVERLNAEEITGLDGDPASDYLVGVLLGIVDKLGLVERKQYRLI